MDEWQELSEDFKKLEKTNTTYVQKLSEVIKLQKECQAQIDHQVNRMANLKQKVASAKNSNISSHLKEEMMKRQAHLQEIQQNLPRESGRYLKIGLGSVNVSILNQDDKLKYKTEYENFKLIFSAVAFAFTVINMVFVYRTLERIYLFLLVWYYCTLTIRESILKVNGSRIKGWWRWHHFISMGTSAILLIWPESESWKLFRTEFMVFNAYLTVVQFLQFRYQTGVLYRLKALGERHNMDITIEGFHAWMWRGLTFLFPFLFAVYLFQLHLACNLYTLRSIPGTTWHVTALAILFLLLSMGNILVSLVIIFDKFKNQMSLQYRILSRRLYANFMPVTKENKNGKN